VYSRYYEADSARRAWSTSDDLLLLVVKLLAESPETLAVYAGSWKPRCSSTSTRTRTGAVPHHPAADRRAPGNVCVVGDSDQCVVERARSVQTTVVRSASRRFEKGDAVIAGKRLGSA